MSEHYCTCPIRPKMSKQELLEEIYRAGKNCCAPQYICPDLAREMRRAETEEGYRKYITKKMKREGATAEEIKNLPPRRKKGVAAKVTSNTNVMDL